MFGLASGVLAIAALAFGCHWHDETAARPERTTEPSAASGPAEPAAAPTSGPTPVQWSDANKNVTLRYPGDWKAMKNPDYELMIVPAGAAGDDRRITMDVPDLPPHLPFMIQMSRVEHDYVQDLKKEHPDLQVKDSADAKVPESTARLIRSVWHQNGAAWDDVVLLMIHASGVYILDARTPDAQLAPTRAVFDSIRGSLVWTKH
ncbi:MAG TPA: hypothetical protein VGI81_17665 [Tepidisphaeraceae bacterium]